MRTDQQPATKADIQQLKTAIQSLTTIVERKFATLDERLTLAGQALAGDTDSWRERVIQETAEEDRVRATLDDQ